MSPILPQHVPPAQLAFIIIIITMFIIIIVVVVIVVVQNVYTLFPFTQCEEYTHLAASCRNSCGSSTVTGSSAKRRTSFRGEVASTGNSESVKGRLKPGLALSLIQFP